MAAGRQRHRGIEKRLGLRDHLVAARLVVALAGFARIMRDRVGAVEGIVQAAPARIGGVQRVARVGQRHHQLRPADLADLFVDVFRLDLVGRGLRQQIADLLQEGGIGGHVERLALVGAVPVVDFGLQRIADREQLSVPRREIAQDRGKPGPEASGAIPVLGAASLAMKSNRTGAIFNPWASMRFMAGSFSGKGAKNGVPAGRKQQKARQNGPRSRAF